MVILGQSGPITGDVYELPGPIRTPDSPVPWYEHTHSRRWLERCSPRILAQMTFLYQAPLLCAIALILAACETSPMVPAKSGKRRLVVDVKGQRMDVVADGKVSRTYPVSTSARGVGSQSGSNKTPLGQHRIAKKIGGDQPLGMAFVGRKPTGQMPPILTDNTDAKKDWILSRILWLEGMEPGKNRGDGVDSRRRYIYIHGTNEEGLIGRPASHGCVRMRNRDVIELFDLVAEGTEVEIVSG